MDRQLVLLMLLLGLAAVASSVRAAHDGLLMTSENEGRPQENSYGSLRSANRGADSRDYSSSGRATIPVGQTNHMQGAPSYQHQHQHQHQHAYPPPAYQPPAYQNPAYPVPAPPPSYEAATAYVYPEARHGSGGSGSGGFGSGPVPVLPSQHNPDNRHQKHQKHQTESVPGAAATHNFAGHLRELGKSGFDSTRRAYKDAKPALDNLRGDLGGVMNRVKSNPHIGKVVSATKPRVMNVVNKAQPFVDRSGKRLNSLASRANERIHSRFSGRKQPHQAGGPLAPGSVYPVPPAAARSSGGLSGNSSSKDDYE